MCIICFLTDQNQYHLRKLAQSRSDRFEHSLNVYKKSFIVNFGKDLNKELCSSHKTHKNEQIRTILRGINIKEIEEIFNTLLEVYFSWIDGKSSSAIKRLEKLLKDYKILNSNISHIFDHIFFRGRVSKNFISHWDMFHIPFNKRFIISNQRYSLIGQPLLYLAKSPICVVNELEKTEHLKVSTFRFKSENKLKIFDNTNKFSNIIEQQDININPDKRLENIIDYTNNNIEKQPINTYLFHLIISGCCSFEKRGELKEYGFCEEYVLPQILAQTLKLKKFNGILYSSTKAPNKFRYIHNTILYNLFSHNLAIFTQYDHKKIDDETYVYDKKLYSKFKISNPIIFSQDFEMKDINKIISNINTYLMKNQELINDLRNEKIWGKLDKHSHDVITKISDIILAYSKLFNEDNKNNEDKKKFFDLDNMYAINLHLFMLQNIMLNIRDFYICSNIREE